MNTGILKKIRNRAAAVNSPLLLHLKKRSYLSHNYLTDYILSCVDSCMHQNLVLCIRISDYNMKNISVIRSGCQYIHLHLGIHALKNTEVAYHIVIGICGNIVKMIPCRKGQCLSLSILIYICS